MRRLLADGRLDAAYALRALRRSPAFALVAVLSLALGIGITTVVFSIVNALVLRPLDVKAADQVFFVEALNRRYPGLSFPNYRDLRDHNVTLSNLIGYRIAPMTLAINGSATRAWGYLATGNYFDALGVRPALGRLFTDRDDRPGSTPVIVLSHGYWITRFAGDPRVLGKEIRINKLPFSVIGVAQEGFHGTELFYRSEVWVPLSMQAQVEGGRPWLESRSARNLWVLAHVKDGVSPEQAEANLNALSAELARRYPDTNRDLRVRLVEPGLMGSALRGPTSRFGFGMLLLAVFVTMTACANLASALSARGADRQREIGIRASLGAARGRIVRQLLVEALILAALGGAAAYVVVLNATNALSAWRLSIGFPTQFEIRTDVHVLLFTSAALLAAGLLAGLMPARQGSRTHPNVALKSGGQSRVRGWPLRDVLIALQVAVCCVLVTGCILAVRGLQQALTHRLGFEPDDVATARFDPGAAGYAEAAGRQVQQRALEAIARLPGVTAAAYGNSLPLAVDQSTTTVYAEGAFDLPLSDVRRAFHYQVSPGFLKLLGIRLLAGRDVEFRDTAEAPLVAVVNRTFAQQVLSTGDAIGMTFRFGRNAPPVEVVGIVETGKYQSLTEVDQPAVFQPILQSYNSSMVMVVKSQIPAEQMGEAIRRALAGLAPDVPVDDVGHVLRLLGFALLPSRAAAIALTAFGVVALLLAMTGVHGLVAYAVRRRERELAVRIALGAARFHIVRVIVGRVGVLLAAGIAAGTTASWALEGLFASVIHEASLRDPMVFSAVVLAIVASGAIACWAPARRLLRIDPIIALRAE
ncbi:MAG: ABC transporter permease [Vicinamibacterales bacterium]